MLWLLCRDSHKIHIFIGYCTLSGIKTPCPTFCLHLSDTPLPMLLFSPTLKHCFRWRGRSLFCDRSKWWLDKCTQLCKISVWKFSKGYSHGMLMHFSLSYCHWKCSYIQSVTNNGFTITQKTVTWMQLCGEEAYLDM